MIDVRFRSSTVRRAAVAAAMALALLAAGGAPAGSVGNAISYQGSLKDGGSPANGAYDFEFRLFTSQGGAQQIGSTVTADDVVVADGLFSTSLDFGAGVFGTNELYLEIGVRPGASAGAYTTLAGRVRLDSVPFAQFSLNADTVDGLDSTVFANTNHGHSSLNGFGGNPVNAVSVDAQGVTTFVNSLVLPGANELRGQGGKVTLDTGTLELVVDESGGVVSIAPGGVPSAEMVVRGGDSLDGETGPGSLDVRGGDVLADGSAGGGAVSIIGGTGATGAVGGGGGFVRIRGGSAGGAGGSFGGSVTIEGGDGAPGGERGSVDLSGREVTAWDRFTAQEGIRIFGPLTDSDDSVGMPGQVLTTTGTGVLWDTLDVDANTLDGIDSTGFATATHVHSSLAALDGSPANAVSTNSAGDVTLSTGTVSTPSGLNIVANASNTLLLDRTAGAGEFSVAIGTETRISAEPSSSIGQVALQPKARASSGDGYTMSVSGGNGPSASDGAGGTLLLEGGRGGGTTAGTAIGGAGGTVFVRGGDAHGNAARSGGNVTLVSGQGISGGQNGGVFLVGTDSFVSGADGGDISIESGAGPLDGAGAGGDISIAAGPGGGGLSGAGGRGGDVTITAGDGDTADGTPQRGGNITLDPGTQITGGGNGIVQVTSRLAVQRTSASHPIHVGTSASNGNGAHVTNGGVWTNGSDVNSKTEFEHVDAKDILARVLALPVTRWQYKGEPEGVRHIGPMAQDFMAAFHLGESERHIGTVDADGVALVAIKGLHEETDERLKTLETENAELRARLAAMEQLVAALAAKKE